MMEQLRNSNSAVHLRWCTEENRAACPDMVDAFVPTEPWTLVSTIKDKDIETGPAVIEVYALSSTLKERR